MFLLVHYFRDELFHMIYGQQVGKRTLNTNCFMQEKVARTKFAFNEQINPASFVIFTQLCSSHMLNL